MSTVHDVEIAAYVPRWLRASVGAQPTGLARPSAVPRHAAVLLLDIAGFTEITERLARQTEFGAERLSDLLNDCFAALTDVVEAYGGDITAFTGDGFLAVWNAAEFERPALAAAQCALALRETMEVRASSPDTPLRLRISIDAGTVFYCALGGHEDVWRHAAVGAPFERVGAAYNKALVGEIALCGAAWREIAETCEGVREEGAFRLTGLKDRGPPPAPPKQGLYDGKVVRSLAPKVVLDRLQISSSKWLAEIRYVSVLCVKFLNVDFDGELIGALQACVLAAQRAYSRHEGAIFGFWMDDKGVCVAEVFGAPPRAHEDDPLRAVEAGLAILEELASTRVSASIGIGSGRLFCGDYGGRSRREYGVLGPAINTAARLMDIADGSVLCDLATAQAVQGRISFSVEQSRRVKGRTEPLAIYRPIGLLTPLLARSPGPMIGRHAERLALQEKLNQAQAGAGGIVFVQGEPGIGKSRLLADFVVEARACEIPVAQGFATAIDRSTPYFAWRQILGALIRPEAGVRLEDVLAEKLQHDPTLLSWAPLLREVLPLALSPTPLTERIVGAARAASLETLFAALLHAPNSPHTLIFEDLHWFDEASLNLLKAVVRRAPRLLIVASRRSPGRGPAEAASDFEDALQIELSGLEADGVAEVIRRRLRVDQAPAALVRFILARTGGNPLYCEELVLAMREASALFVERGTVRFSPEALTSANMALPASVEAAVIARVDALRPEEQLLLKTASAFGGAFDPTLLQNVYPGELSSDELAAVLDRLVGRELLRVGQTGHGPEYRFPHAISEEATYSLLPLAQRRMLHAAIASRLESAYAQRIEAYFGQLARHWERAGETQRALYYLEKAAMQSLRSYANHDALHYVERALELCRDSGTESDSERLSRWETLLGDAYTELADFDRSSPHYHRALKHAGQTIAENAWTRATDLIAHVAEQVWLRLGLAVRAADEAERERSRRFAHIRERLAERHFFRNESVAVLDETLAAVNLAERAGATAEMISGYSALAIGLGMSGLTVPGRFYRQRAMDLAQPFRPTPEVARAHLLAAVFEYGLGDWEASELHAQRSLSLYRQLGDRGRAQTVITILGSSCIMRGDLERADQLQQEASEEVEAETPQGRAWRLAAKAMVATIRGQAEAVDLEVLEEAGRGNLAGADELLCFGSSAAGYLQRGESAKALAAAEHGFDLLRQTNTLWGNYIYGASGIIEVYLALATGEGAGADRCRRRAALACEFIARATRRSPVCQPRALLLRGRVEWLFERKGRALRSWRKAAELAARYRLLREEGLVLYELGRASAATDPLAGAKLAKAAEILASIGAVPELTRARAALSSISSERP